MRLSKRLRAVHIAVPAMLLVAFSALGQNAAAPRQANSRLGPGINTNPSESPEDHAVRQRLADLGTLNHLVYLGLLNYDAATSTRTITPSPEAATMFPRVTASIIGTRCWVTSSTSKGATRENDVRRVHPVSRSPVRFQDLCALPLRHALVFPSRQLQYLHGAGI